VPSCLRNSPTLSESRIALTCTIGGQQPWAGRAQHLLQPHRTPTSSGNVRVGRASRTRPREPSARSARRCASCRTSSSRPPKLVVVEQLAAATPRPRGHPCPAGCSIALDDVRELSAVRDTPPRTTGRPFSKPRRCPADWAIARFSRSATASSNRLGRQYGRPNRAVAHSRYNRGQLARRAGSRLLVYLTPQSQFGRVATPERERQGAYPCLVQRAGCADATNETVAPAEPS